MRKLRYYISGHGLGHASRSCQIIATLRRRHPRIAIEVVSNAHPWFFRHALDPAVPLRSVTLDLGVLQHDSLVMREEETLQAYRAFLPERARLIAAEAASLQAEGVSLVVADVPSAAFAAARQANIPAVGISNFTWDWIYRGLAERYGGYDDIVDLIAADYAACSRWLRLPFAGGNFSGAPVEDLPLVARTARCDAALVRERLGLAAGQKLGLISFGGFGLADTDFAPLAALPDWVFLTESPLPRPLANLRHVPAGAYYYPDLVAAADVVITKPGYGIVSEAIANRTAVLYTSRGEFREQALLVAGLERFARCRLLSNAQLRSGHWGEDLERLLTQPEPREMLPADGDRIAADRLAALLETSG